VQNVRIYLSKYRVVQIILYHINLYNLYEPYNMIKYEKPLQSLIHPFLNLFKYFYLVPNPKLYRRAKKTRMNLRSNRQNPFTRLQHMTERKNRIKNLFRFNSGNRIRNRHWKKSNEVILKPRHTVTLNSHGTRRLYSPRHEMAVYCQDIFYGVLCHKFYISSAQKIRFLV